MARLMFDAQVFQTPAWYRGMGKYSFELIRAMASRNIETNEWDTIDVIISSVAEIDTELRKEIVGLPGAKLHELNLDPNDILNPEVTAKHNRGVIDDFIADKGNDNSFIILSLMQGEISPVFPSSEDVHKSVLFYDLIPLMFHKIYLQNPITRKEYLSKLSELLRADTYLAISKTVANDLAVYVGIEPNDIVSIDGAPIAHGDKIETISVPHPFILMPTGNDLRKNNRRGIDGFNLFNKKHDNKYTLVITSFFKEEQISELSKLSENIVFTGNLPGTQLNYLYKETSAVLFPSEYEGLGLPVLEALENNVPVACSDITVFREISQTAFEYFDPTKIHSIADGLERAIVHRSDPIETKKVLSKYSWGNTAIIAEKVVTRDKKPAVTLKKEVVIVGSDFAGKSRVGKMILQSHASLNRLSSVTYYENVCDGGVESRIDFLPYIAKLDKLVANSPIFTNYLDRTHIYHMTNQKDMVRIALGVLARPGILILHDLDMRKVWNELREQKLISNERHELESKINHKFGNKSTEWLGSLVANQKAVIVFSQKAEESINLIAEKMNKHINVVRLPIPANNLVYHGITPTIKGPALDLKSLIGIDDMQYEKMISRAERLVVPMGATSTEVLLPSIESAKYSKTDLSGYRDFSTTLYNLVSELKRGHL